MKKIIILLILLFTSPAFAWSPALNAICASGGAVATCTNYDEETGTDDNTSGDSPGWIGQGAYNPATNINVCQVDVDFVSDISGKSITMSIYTMTGDALNNQVCTSTITGTGTGWQSFPITGDCNLANGTTYVIAVSHATLGVSIYDSSGKTLDSGWLGKWNSSTKANSGKFTTYHAGLKIYKK
jgi:hypothetical protein